MSTSEPDTEIGCEDTVLFLPESRSRSNTSLISRARKSLSWDALKDHVPTYGEVANSVSAMFQAVQRGLENSRDYVTTIMRRNRVANQNRIPAGTLLLEAEPFAFVLDEYFRLTHCAYCFSYRTESDDFSRCGGCFHIKYCDAVCQHLDWKEGHRYECRGLRLWRIEQHLDEKELESFDAARLIIRVMAKLKKGNTPCRETFNSGKSRGFIDLQTHFEELKKDDQSEIVAVHEILTRILRGRADLQIPTGDDFVELFGRIHTNTFAICDAEYIKMGIGFYIGASIFNHSCNPTAIVTFESTKMFVRNLVDLPPDFPIEEVTISYIDPIQPTSRRLAELRARYYFECTCERCHEQLDDSEMISIGCQDCKQPVNPTLEDICNYCDKEPSPRFKQKSKKLQDKAKRLIKVGSLEQIASGSHVEETLNIMLKLGYSRTHWLIVQLSMMAVDIAIEEQQYAKAFAFTELTLPGLRRYLHRNHAMLGLNLLKAAKLAWHLEIDQLAKKYIKGAVKAITISYGKDSTFYKNFIGGIAQDILKCNATSESDTDGSSKENSRSNSEESAHSDESDRVDGEEDGTVDSDDDEAGSTAASDEVEAGSSASRDEVEANSAGASDEDESDSAAASVDDEARSSAASDEDEADSAADSDDDEARSSAASDEDEADSAAASDEDEADSTAASDEDEADSAAASHEDEADSAAASDEDEADSAAVSDEESRDNQPDVENEDVDSDEEHREEDHGAEVTTDEQA